MIYIKNILLSVSVFSVLFIDIGAYATLESDANCSSGIKDNDCNECVVFSSSGMSSCGSTAPGFSVTGTSTMPGTTQVKTQNPPTPPYYPPSIISSTGGGPTGWRKAISETVQFLGFGNPTIRDCGKEGVNAPGGVYDTYIADSKLALQCYATIFKSGGKSAWSTFLDLSKAVVYTNPMVMPVAACNRLNGMSYNQMQSEMAAAKAQAKGLWDVFDKKIMPMLLQIVLNPDPLINNAIATVKTEGYKMSTDRRHYEIRMLQACSKLGEFAPDIIAAVLTGGASGEARLATVMTNLERKVVAESGAAALKVAAVAKPSLPAEIVANVTRQSTHGATVSSSQAIAEGFQITAMKSYQIVGDLKFKTKVLNGNSTIYDIDIFIDSSERNLGMSRDLFSRMISENPNVTRIESQLGADNKKAFSNAISRGLSEEQAFRETPAYRIRAANGFTVILPESQGVGKLIPVLVVGKP